LPSTHSRYRFPIPQNANPLPHSPAPVPVPPPRFSRPVHCALGVLSEVIKSSIALPVPQSQSPIPIPHSRSPCHHTTLSRRDRHGGTGTAAQGGKESLIGHRQHGTTPRHLHSRFAIVTYKKNSPHSERNPVLLFLFPRLSLIPHHERNCLLRPPLYTLCSLYLTRLPISLHFPTYPHPSCLSHLVIPLQFVAFFLHGCFESF